MTNDRSVTRPPQALAEIISHSQRHGFAMASDPEVGSLLRALAASKPGGRLLELGTGTGIGTAWLLDGMDPGATLTSIDTDPAVSSIAGRHLGQDGRLTLLVGDGGAFLDEASEAFDLIYADAWPGKFTHLDRALALVRPGGIYVVDDLLPQSNWPDDHAPKVDRLVEDLASRPGFTAARMAWSSGVMLLVRTSEG